jgi:hypothetical protein
MRAVEHRNVVQTEKAALEHVIAVAVLAVDPPGVIQQQLVKHPLKKAEIALAALHPFGPERLERAHRMNRRIDIAERPFIGGNLAVGMQVALP